MGLIVDAVAKNKTASLGVFSCRVTHRATSQVSMDSLSTPQDRVRKYSASIQVAEFSRMSSCQNHGTDWVFQEVMPKNCPQMPNHVSPGTLSEAIRCTSAVVADHSAHS